MKHVYCIIVEGAQMNDALHGLLYDTAQDMMEEGKKSQRVRTSTGEGEVTTKHQQYYAGSFAGTLFDAKLELGRKTIKVRFGVRPSRTMRANDPRGQWVWM